MKPWEDVKRRRLRRRLIGYCISTVAVAAGLILLLGNPAKPQAIKPISSTPATRNAERTAALASLSQAVAVYLQYHQSLPVAIPKTPTQICTASSADCRKAKTVDLNFLVTPDVGLQSLPSDPVGGPGMTASGYTIMQDGQGRLELAAPRAEDGATISLRTK